MPILLAAGHGTRLRPLTHDRPKALLNAAGRPLLQDTLDELPESTIILGHGARAVQAHLQDAKVKFIMQSSQLGPGHALFHAKDSQPEEFLVIPGDAWYAPELLQRLKDSEAPAMIRVPDARSGRHGVPVIEDGKATSLIEQEQAGDRASGFCGGAYKVNRRIFDYLEACNFSMRDAIRMDIQKNGPWNLVQAKAREYVDVIEVQDLLKVHDHLMPEIESMQKGTIEEGATVTGLVHIDEGSIIRAGAVVRGPVFIGQNCDIGPGAVLMPGTAMRNRVRVGPLTVLSRCSLASNITIGPHSNVRDAVIDNGATLGAYVQCEDSTGIIIGADARVGDRVTIQAEGVVGRNATVASGRTIKTVPDGGHAV